MCTTFWGNKLLVLDKLNENFKKGKKMTIKKVDYVIG